MDFINITEYQKSDYKKIIKIIFKLCSSFKIIDEYGDLEIKKMEIYPNLLNMKRSNKWEGTMGKGRKAYIYFFEAAKMSEKFFNKYDSFFYEDSIDNTVCNTALENQYDYSFLERKTEDCILYVITHEKMVFLRKDIYNE